MFKIITYLKNKIKQVYLYVRRIFLSYLIRPFLFKNRRPFKKDEIRTILVIKIDRIGDIVVSLPGLKALREAFPEARISILVKEGRDKLLNGIPWIDEVISYDGFIRAARYLKQFKFDLAIDLLMEYTIKTALLAYVISRKYSVGFDIEGRGCFFNLKSKPSPENKHMSQHILDLVIKISGLSPKTAMSKIFYLKIPILEENRRCIEPFLSENGVQKQDLLIGIHPGGNYPSQRWPIERFSRIINNIIERYQAKVVIMGDAKDMAIIEKAMKLVKRKGVITAIGLPLDKLATLISMTDLLICNNSGLLHMGCALDVPTISTMGPTDPHLWRPMGEKNVVIRKNLSCSPCTRGWCIRHDCMKLITTEEVTEAVQSQLDNVKHKKSFARIIDRGKICAVSAE